MSLLCLRPSSAPTSPRAKVKVLPMPISWAMRCYITQDRHFESKGVSSNSMGNGAHRDSAESWGWGGVCDLSCLLLQPASYPLPSLLPLAFLPFSTQQICTLLLAFAPLLPCLECSPPETHKAPPPHLLHTSGQMGSPTREASGTPLSNSSHLLTLASCTL